ncbi:uncharacterized protein STEHIDRAFT_159240 [Stereum hirsutum FP-91666 SS1]|uniref:uncharacterized protein n=1 Tax=Stereum hirsutum (strain FP-91666) TaxID=721885 RepID=UPI0004449DC5|nr:uncharacterized protein STEHIDRAFT_159240 [Stereum hirsutum FP-91666 SS1]EIM84575.1 hypothetical protein STEHIDRAFT_159240 [Stereum hirsutum FP-91666 SS1]
MARAWGPDYGKKDQMHNGTASTYLALEDCSLPRPEALDPEPLDQARTKQRRKQLTQETVRDRLHFQQLSDIFSLHILNFLIEKREESAQHSELVTLRLHDLNTYFQDHETDFDKLLKHAKVICEKYATTTRYQIALAGGKQTEEFFNMGSPWTESASKRKMPVGWKDVGDAEHANVFLRSRDSLLHYEFQSAIADGDIGWAMYVMSVWTFTFLGSNKHKYVDELLALTFNFEFEYSAELQEVTLTNWLCNLTRFLGGWFPLDLLQGKNIKQLKVSQKKGTVYGAKFFRRIVSINVRALIQSQNSLRKTVRLGKRKKTYKRTKKANVMRELIPEMWKQGLHSYAKLATGTKIREFLARTLTETANLHGTDEIQMVERD